MVENPEGLVRNPKVGPSRVHDLQGRVGSVLETESPPEATETGV